MKPHGAKLLAVEDATGAIYSQDGLDPDELLAHAKQHGGISDYPGAEAVDHKTFLATKADIFIPAALESQLTEETTPLLNVRLVAEGANGPTTPEGDAVLFEADIDLLPDVLCNAGGVIVSYFEWLQNKRAEFWDLEEVDSKLHKMLMSAYARVQKAAVEFQCDWRTAAYIVALRRLRMVYENRGIFP
jgi:glutamate dehydrogenase (NAD(P)+)